MVTNQMDIVTIVEVSSLKHILLNNTVAIATLQEVANILHLFKRQLTVINCLN